MSSETTNKFPKFPKSLKMDNAEAYTPCSINKWKEDMKKVLAYRLEHESDRLRLPSMIYQELQLALGLNPKLQKLLDESVKIK